MDGVTTIVNVAHLRLCHSRIMFVRVYPRETQAMVFDARVVTPALARADEHRQEGAGYTPGGAIQEPTDAVIAAIR